MIFFLVAGWPMPESNSLVWPLWPGFLLASMPTLAERPHILSGNPAQRRKEWRKPDLYGRVLLLCVQSGAHSRPAPGGRSRLAATSPAAPGGAAWRLARLMSAHVACRCLALASSAV